MTQELRIHLEITIPWPENRLDAADRSNTLEEAITAFRVEIEGMGGHYHAIEKGPVRVRKRKSREPELPLAQTDSVGPLTATEVANRMKASCTGGIANPIIERLVDETLAILTRSPDDLLGPLPDYLTSKGVGQP